jgi:hypothetical protein
VNGDLIDLLRFFPSFLFHSQIRSMTATRAAKTPTDIPTILAVGIRPVPLELESFVPCPGSRLSGGLVIGVGARAWLIVVLAEELAVKAGSITPGWIEWTKVVVVLVLLKVGAIVDETMPDPG